MIKSPKQTGEMCKDIELPKNPEELIDRLVDGEIAELQEEEMGDIIKQQELEQTNQTFYPETYKEWEEINKSGREL